MDPVWAAFAEFWWIGPTVIGAGTLGWFGLRSQRTTQARRLAYDASRVEVKTARRDATTARIAVRVARAELARAQAERATGRATTADVTSARRALDQAQRETKAAAATARARRASLTAARAALAARPADPSQFPLARLMAEDDAHTARWMTYETDAAKVIAFPAMTDATVPTTAAFLAELRSTRALRPASSDARITPAQFGAYRDAVMRLGRAFDAAEAEAWRRARASGSAPEGPGPDSAQPNTWMLSAQEIAQNLTQSVLSRSAEAFARATASREQAAPASPESTPTPADDAAPPKDRGTAGSTPPPPPTPPRTWPIPSRSPRSPRA